MKLKIENVIKYMALFASISALDVTFASENEDTNSKVLKDSFMPADYDRAKALEEGKKKRFERRNSVSNFRKLDPDRKLPEQPKAEGDSSRIIKNMLTSVVMKTKRVCKIASMESNESRAAKDILKTPFKSERLRFEEHEMLRFEKKIKYISSFIDNQQHINEIKIDGSICDAMDFRGRISPGRNADEMLIDRLSENASFFIPELSKFAAESEVKLIEDGIDVDAYSFGRDS